LRAELSHNAIDLGPRADINPACWLVHYEHAALAIADTAAERKLLLIATAQLISERAHAPPVDAYLIGELTPKAGIAYSTGSPTFPAKPPTGRGGVWRWCDARAALDARISPSEANAWLQAILLDAPFSNGFYYGGPGFSWTRAAAQLGGRQAPAA
jgi:hypothetical protein